MHKAKDYIEKVERDWRPRAPTLMVLEDPHAEEAARLIQVLATLAAKTREEGTRHWFEFPVRLLVVNQSIPIDLGLEPEGPADAVKWKSGLGHLRGGPWVLDEQHYLTFIEWRTLRRMVFESSDPRGWGVDAAGFERITRGGNPLLADALMRWLGRQSADKAPDLAEVSAARLLEDRARRVHLALGAAGLASHEQRMALSAATLAGGIGWEPGRQPEVLRCIQEGALQRVFPNELLARRVPPIRPDLIGFAFVDLVVQEPSESGAAFAASESAVENAELLAEIAWRAEPFGTLSTLEKLTDRGFALDSPSAASVRRTVVGALQRVPAPGSAPDPERLARALARHQMLKGGLLETVATHIGHLSSAGADRLIGEIIELIGRSEISTSDALAVFSLTLNRRLYFDANRECVESLIVLVRQLAARLTPRGTVPIGFQSLPQEGFAALGHAVAHLSPVPWVAIVDLVDDVRQCRAMARTGLWYSVSTALVENLRQPCYEGAKNISTELASWLVVSAAASVGVGPVLDSSASRIDKVIKEYSDVTLPKRVAELLARACSYLARAHSLCQEAVRAREYAMKVAEICAPFTALQPAERRELAEGHASAWLYAAYAHSERNEAAEARKCAIKVGEICSAFEALPLNERRELAERQASAWTQAACAHESAQARECAMKVDEICAPFETLPLPDRRELAEWHAGAWTRASYAHCQRQELAEARECAIKVGEISASFSALPLPARRALAERHAAAWNHVACAHSERQEVAAARECAMTVGQISAPFEALPIQERRGLAEWHASTWSHTACAHAQGQKAAEARTCAIKVGEIGAPFEALSLTERRELAEWHAAAWSSAAYAYSQRLEAAEAHRCAVQVTEIGAPFKALRLAERRSLAERTAQAWTYASEAFRGRNESEQSQECFRTAGAIQKQLNEG